MGKVLLDMAMSLDGYIVGPHDEDHGLNDWFFSPEEGSKKVVDESLASLGAIIMGRQTYEVADKQNGFVDTPYKITHFVLTHHVPEKKARGAATIIFVTDGIESALAQAKASAGDKDVALGGGANIAQQFLKAGLVDDIQIHLIPKLLGEGKRLFAPSGTEPIELELTRTIEAVGVTHLKFRVIK